MKKGDKIYRNLDTEFEKELSKPVKRQIGLSVYFDKNVLILKDEDNITIKFPVEASEIAKYQEKMNETFVKQFSKTGESDFYIRDIKITSDIPFMPISQINDLRRISFDKLMEKRVQSYKREVQKPIKYEEYFTKDLDYKANIHNESAKEFYEKCGCKILEMSMESKLPKRQIELMRTKHCIKYALNMCKSPEKLFLQDEKGVKYPLNFDCKNCEMSVLSPN